MASHEPSNHNGVQQHFLFYITDKIHQVCWIDLLPRIQYLIYEWYFQGADITWYLALFPIAPMKIPESPDGTVILVLQDIC